MVTSHFPDDPSGENYGWNTSEDRFTFQHERQITRIEGDRIFINAPLSHSLDRLSNATIEHYTDRRVSNVGIEGIRGTSIYNANETGVYDGRTQFDDEDHALNFVKFSHAEDSWARDVTGEHLVYAAVQVGVVSRSITVENASYVEPVSIVTGGRRYAFLTNGSLTLGRYRCDTLLPESTTGLEASSRLVAGTGLADDRVEFELGDIVRNLI